MRIAIGQLWQESNTFNPILTTQTALEHFGIGSPYMATEYFHLRPDFATPEPKSAL